MSVCAAAALSNAAPTVALNGARLPLGSKALFEGGTLAGRWVGGGTGPSSLVAQTVSMATQTNEERSRPGARLHEEELESGGRDRGADMQPSQAGSGKIFYTVSRRYTAPRTLV